MKRLILEMGMGNDLYGEDYTKAGCRAVQDALHHSSLSLFSYYFYISISFYSNYSISLYVST